MFHFLTIVQMYDCRTRSRYTKPTHKSWIPWADPEGGGEFWQKCAYRIREMVLV